VVSWNTRGLLEECLASLEPDLRDGLADVWVVDNASSDGSAELVQERFPAVSLIASDTNLGFGAAVNLVAGQTSASWLAPANADVRLEPGALAHLVQAGERHPEAAVIAPRLILPDGTTQHSVYPFPTIPFTLANAFGAINVSRRLAHRWTIDRGFDRDRSGEVPWAVGAFLVVRRSAWVQVGGFDEAQWMYAEDLDLGWRLRRAGWTARYEPEAHVQHAQSAATDQAWGAEIHDRWVASSYAWLLRRRGIAVTRAVALLNISGFGLRAAIHTVAAVCGSRRARRARREALDIARTHRVGLRPRSELATVR
jgi:GT2 family glycosyltransferase